VATCSQSYLVEVGDGEPVAGVGAGEVNFFGIGELPDCYARILADVVGEIQGGELLRAINR
jgi:hypothetical protein